MVLTKQELIDSLKHEAHILVHLTGKVLPGMLDYRPTPKQRSTIELLRYMTFMGPVLVTSVKNGAFDVPGWTAAESASASMGLEEVRAAFEKQGAGYAESVGAFSNEELRGEIEMFGRKSSRGALLVNIVLAGHAAYRTQLFLYLKANGRDELNTFNLWAGMDGTM